MTTTVISKALIVAAAAAVLLTSACAPSYVCEHDYGLSKGTESFSNCMVHEEEVKLQRSAILMQIGHDLMEQSREGQRRLTDSAPLNPFPQQHYCQGQATGNGTFSATCN
jgi:hypothetical protein